jgi:serine/threonine protein kinase
MRVSLSASLCCPRRLKDGAIEWEAKQFTSEMELLTQVSHDNICRLFAFSTDGPQRCLVLELCMGGSLEDRLTRKAPEGCPPPAPLSCLQRVRIAVGVARALEHLHGLTPQMIHR